MVFYKKFLQRFHELPDNVPASHYRSWVFINYAFLLTLIIHFLWIFMFALVGVMPLALFNIASTIIWAVAIYSNLKGHTKTGMVFGNIEVVLHVWLATIIIGWNTGFHYYILVLPMFYFLTHWPIVGKIVLSAINCTMYILLSYYFKTHTPVSAIDPMLINTFNYGNIAAFGFALSSIALYYRAAVIEAETKLELEHQKTNSALIARNEILAQLNEELAEAADYVKNMLPKPINEGPVKTEWRLLRQEHVAEAHKRRTGENGMEIYPLNIIGGRRVWVSLDRRGSFCDIFTGCFRPWCRSRFAFSLSNECLALADIAEYGFQKFQASFGIPEHGISRRRE